MSSVHQESRGPRRKSAWSHDHSDWAVPNSRERGYKRSSPGHSVWTSASSCAWAWFLHLCENPRNPFWLKSVAVESLFLGGKKVKQNALSKSEAKLDLKQNSTLNLVHLSLLVKCNIFSTYLYIHKCTGRKNAQVMSEQINKFPQIEHTCVASPQNPLYTYFQSPPWKVTTLPTFNITVIFAGCLSVG